MEFKLCYKKYEFKPNLASMKKFKEATGLDLWAVLVKYITTFTNDEKSGLALGDRLFNLAQVIDFIDAAQLFYCVAQQCSSSLTIDEIEDAMFHAGISESKRDDDMSEPYQFVLCKLAFDVFEYHEQLARDTKKP